MGKQGKPGELALACGLGCLLIGPVVLGILSEEDGELAALQNQGVVAQATVTGHSQAVENYTQRGKPRTRTNHYIDLSYDLNAATPYSQWLASGEIAPSAYPATVTDRIDVGETGQADHPLASRVPVVFVPGQADSPMLVERTAKPHLVVVPYVALPSRSGDDDTGRGADHRGLAQVADERLG